MFVRRYEADTPLAAGEHLLFYRRRDHRIKIGTDAFFFQEGHAMRYQRAKFGELRVDASGESLLIGLRDEKSPPARRGAGAGPAVIASVRLLAMSAASAAFVVLAASSAGACRAPAPRRSARRLRIATGAPGGGFQPLGDALAHAVGAVLPNTDISIQFSAGAVSNIELIQSGNADIALAFSDVAYIASVGRLEGRPQPFTRLRAIAVLQLTPVHLVAGQNSGIKEVDGSARQAGRPWSARAAARCSPRASC